MFEFRKIKKYNISKINAVNHNNFSTFQKPVSNAYNIYFNKEKEKNISNKTAYNIKNKKNSSKIVKRKIPLYNNPFYSPNNIIKKINYKILYPKNENLKIQAINGSAEYSSSIISSTKREYLMTSPNNSIFPKIYKRENTSGDSSNYLSLENENRIFKNNINSCLNLTSNKFENYNIKSYNNPRFRKLSSSNKNQKIININLYNNKKNYSENNIINDEYIDKGKKNNCRVIFIKKNTNRSFNNNNSPKRDGNNSLTRRRSIPKKSNYSFYYNSSIINEKSDKNEKEEINNEQKISKRRINYLPKVTKKNISKNYNENAIIKIQSVFRTYLLIKRLDYYLMCFMRLSFIIKIIEKIFKKKLLYILKNISKNKDYNIYQNKFSFKRKKYYKSIYFNNNEKGIELRNKNNNNILINNEKNELQIKYNDFINKYNDLIKNNHEMQNEIEKLKKKNNELLFQLNNLKKPIIKSNSKKYIIQKENNINIISSNKNKINSPKYNNKKYENNSFTLGFEGKNIEEIFQTFNIETQKKNKLYSLLLKNKYNYKFNLFKNLLKFYYFGLKRYVNANKKIIYHRGGQINYFNKKFNNNENINFIYNCMSIRTLSENSSSFLTDKKSQNVAKERNIKNIKTYVLREEDNKKK